MASLTCSVFLLLGGYLCFGQSALPYCDQPQSVVQSVHQKVDAYLRMKSFQGSVLIAERGKVLFSRGYGLANAEHQISNTPQTVFRLGSITKQFTAVAILQLQEQGALTVNDLISKFLPDYPQGNKITIHHLLTHTSGIPSITEFPNLSIIERQPSTPRQVMAYFKDLPLEFPPGTDCKYSDSGYIILGAIIEAVTHVSYEAYLQKQFFVPLGMKATYFDHNQRVILHRASGYGRDAQGEIINAEFIEMSFPHGAGSLASTVEDLYLWDRALTGERLLSKETRALLFRAQPSSGKNEITYGYGFFIDQKRGTVGHMGSIEGFRAALYRHVDCDMTLIVLSNQEETEAVALEQELFFLASSSWRS
jgi:CubicO group peptidase (beta-lactamase class C family)